MMTWYICSSTQAKDIATLLKFPFIDDITCNLSPSTNTAGMRSPLSQQTKFVCLLSLTVNVIHLHIWLVVLLSLYQIQF